MYEADLNIYKIKNNTQIRLCSLSVNQMCLKVVVITITTVVSRGQFLSELSLV